MNPEAQRVRDLFVAAVKLPSNQWKGFLEGACAGDDDLRGQVSDLLREHQQAGSFLDRPAACLGATGALMSGVRGQDSRVRDQESGGSGRLTPDSYPLTPGERPGTAVGPYKLLQLIGEGGMGAVWLAEQRQPVQRRVALNLLRRGWIPSRWSRASRRSGKPWQ